MCRDGSGGSVGGQEPSRRVGVIRGRGAGAGESRWRRTTVVVIIIVMMMVIVFVFQRDALLHVVHGPAAVGDELPRNGADAAPHERVGQLLGRRREHHSGGSSSSSLFFLFDSFFLKLLSVVLFG